MNVFICDDQPVFTEEFSRQLEGYFKKQELSLRLFTFLSGERLLDCDIKPDIIFLDIKLYGMSGLETARQLRKSGCQAKIIFLTAYKQYVFQAFDVDASHYLIKPVKEEKLESVLNHVISQTSQKKQCLSLQSGSALVRLPYEDLLYLEVRDRKVSVHTRDNSVDFYGKLEALEKQLPDSFFRCHRSFIVNMEYVMSFNKTDLFLSNGHSIPVSKRKYPAFSKAFMDFVRQEGLT